MSERETVTCPACAFEWFNCDLLDAREQEESWKILTNKMRAHADEQQKRAEKAERELEEAREALDFTEQAPGRIQEIMRSNGLVIDDLGDAHQKLAFTVYTELCECASQCEAARAAAKEEK